MKEAYASDSIKLKYGFIANILKDSGGKFLIGEKVKFDKSTLDFINNSFSEVSRHVSIRDLL